MIYENEPKLKHIVTCILRNAAQLAEQHYKQHFAKDRLPALKMELQKILAGYIAVRRDDPWTGARKFFYGSLSQGSNMQQLTLFKHVEPVSSELDPREVAAFSKKESDQKSLRFYQNLKKFHDIEDYHGAIMFLQSLHDAWYMDLESVRLAGFRYRMIAKLETIKSHRQVVDTTSSERAINKTIADIVAAKHEKLKDSKFSPFFTSLRKMTDLKKIVNDQYQEYSDFSVQSVEEHMYYAEGFNRQLDLLHAQEDHERDLIKQRELKQAFLDAKKQLEDHLTTVRELYGELSSNTNLAFLNNLIANSSEICPLLQLKLVLKEQDYQDFVQEIGEQVQKQFAAPQEVVEPVSHSRAPCSVMK